MTVDLDLREINNLDLSFDEYFYLYLLNTKNGAEKSLVKKILKRGVGESVVNSLITKGLVIEDNGIKLSSLGKDLFNIKINLAFKELLNEYPDETPEGRKLKGKLRQCELLYLKIIGSNKLKHKLVLSCLEEELEIKRRSNSMKYLKNLHNWLKDEEYKKYIEYVTEQ